MVEFDTVLTQDLRPLFSGPEEDVIEWIIANATLPDMMYVGVDEIFRLMTIDEYMTWCDEDS